MKKAKIIIPALGLLVLSTAASITGTVAWFTATTTVTTSASVFKVAALDGALEVNMTKNQGTANVTGGQSVTVKEGAVLGDASYDHASGKLYTDTVTAGTYTDLGTDDGEKSWDVNKSGDAALLGKAYYAVSWNMEFKYNFKTDLSKTYNLYLNLSTTDSLAQSDVSSSVATTEAKQAINGFRIAFVNGATKKVWAPKRATADCHYINNTSIASPYYADYSAGVVIGSDASGAVVQTAATGATTAINYIGQFVPTTVDTAVTFTVACVAWFEGTDPDIVNGTRMDQVTANMNFFVVANA